MSDNRMNRFESKSSPWKNPSIDFDSSTEYSRSYTSTPASSSVSKVSSIGEIVERPGTCPSPSEYGETDSEYNKSFGPKTPYPKPNKPSWMLNHNKSGFDLKSDPYAKVEYKTSYMEYFPDKESGVPVTSSAPQLNKNKICGDVNNNAEFPPAGEGEIIESETGKIDESLESKLTGINFESGDELNATDDEKKELSPDQTKLKGCETSVPIEPSPFEIKTKVFKGRKHFISPNPPSVKELLSPSSNSSTLQPPIEKLVGSKFVIGQFEDTQAQPSNSSTSNVSPRHGRKKVDNEPSLYATPGLRSFMDSIRR